MVTEVIMAIAWLAALGGIFGAVLAVASRFFAVPVDERAEAITEALPGANCGGCGYMGCAALAAAISSGEARINACPVGGDETAAAVSALMGVDPVSSGKRYRAQVMCSGTKDLAKNKFLYMGITDCISASRVGGGAKECPNGCLGLGTCVANCRFNAIEIINGVAAVDYTKCKACGQCAAACPKKIIKLIPFESRYWVGCVSVDKGAVTRKYCSVGCISCGLCVRKCPTGAITVNDSVASIDYEKCTGCGICEETCPRKIIWSDDTQKSEGLIVKNETGKAG